MKGATQKKNMLTVIPQEVCLKILTHLDESDLSRAYNVSKSFRKLVCLSFSWQINREAKSILDQSTRASEAIQLIVEAIKGKPGLGRVVKEAQFFSKVAGYYEPSMTLSFEFMDENFKAIQAVAHEEPDEALKQEIFTQVVCLYLEKGPTKVIAEQGKKDPYLALIVAFHPLSLKCLAPKRLEALGNAQPEAIKKKFFNRVLYRLEELSILPGFLKKSASYNTQSLIDEYYTQPGPARLHALLLVAPGDERYHDINTWYHPNKNIM